MHRITWGLILSATFLANGCGHWTRPVATYELVVLGDSRPIDLSRRLRDCSQSVRVELENGAVQVRYPDELARMDALRIASDYVDYFPIARRLLGEGVSSALVYALVMERKPQSYTIRAERRGKQWRRTHLGVVIITDDAPIGSDHYWLQVSSGVHELTHKYIDLWMSGCNHDSPVIRWFEDGVCELVSSVFLEQKVPADSKALATTVRAPSDPGLFASAIFDWDVPPDSVSIELATVEADRYRVAYHLVRYIYDERGPETVRALRDAFLSRTPTTTAQLDDVLRSVLQLDSDQLLEAARIHMNERVAAG